MTSGQPLPTKEGLPACYAYINFDIAYFANSMFFVNFVIMIVKQ